jgi:molybdopterin/thiamine biosynthesis adenylyltransferase
MMWNDIVDRQRGIVNFTGELIQAIGRTRVLVAGAGGNGAVSDFLLRIGYQDFTIIDFDVVEATNLNRLPFTPEYIGKAKTEAWKEYLQKVNPEVRVATHVRKVTRNDEKWIEEIISGTDIVALGTSDLEANFVIARVCHRLRKRMVIGPGTSNCWVVSTVTHEDDISIESVGKFGTEGQDVRDVDYKALLSKYMKIYMFPGRIEKIYPEVLQRVKNGEIPPRNCKIFVSMVNAASCWEIVKNTAVMNRIKLQNTKLIKFPVIQIFDPFRGSAYYYNALTEKIGIPNWVTGRIRWYLFNR